MSSASRIMYILAVTALLEGDYFRTSRSIYRTQNKLKIRLKALYDLVNKKCITTYNDT